MTVIAVGGSGGHGLKSFLSIKGNEWAGPDGGDGGYGGHVIAVATATTHSLGHLDRVIRASNGVNGRSKCQHGKNAEHTYVRVPVGTLISDKATRHLLAELSTEHQKYILAKGGAGGRGNHHYLCNEARAPVRYELGGIGESRELIIEMKIAANVGLVGFPNAGKSTLLTALSRATPKIADYPFTTLKPHIGMVQYEDGVQISVTDIPGLIEGSHMNRGLGISFLRHIEKCQILLYVLDMSQSDPCGQLEQLKYELEQYQQHLSNRPHAILANKVDLLTTNEKLQALQDRVHLPVLPISGKEGINVDKLKLTIREFYHRFGK